jgi:hypothetical protein
MSENATVEKAENTEFTPRVLNDYEVRVLAAALKAKNGNGWCDNGFNETMRSLDLPTKPQDEYNHNTVTVEVPTAGTVTYRFDRGDVTTAEEALAKVQYQIDRDKESVGRQSGLRYGSRGPVAFQTDEVKVTGLPDGTDTRSDERKQWDAALAQVKALDATATDDDDEETDY